MASSSKGSSDFWAVVIVGALAVGVVSLLSSGGSSNTSTSGYSGSGYNPGVIYSTPTTPVSSNPGGWTGDTAPFSSHYANGSTAIPMGNIFGPDVVSTGNRWAR